jgi:hypothetical protein
MISYKLIITYFTTYRTTPPSEQISPHPHLIHNNNTTTNTKMAGSKPDLSLLPEERLQLTIKAFQTSQIANIYATSQLYNVLYATLFRRLNDRDIHQDA